MNNLYISSIVVFLYLLLVVILLIAKDISWHRDSQNQY